MRTASISTPPRCRTASAPPAPRYCRRSSDPYIIDARMREHPRLCAIAVLLLIPSAYSEVYVGADDLQKTIDAAPAHSIVVCDPNRVLTLSTPIKIAKPLTVRGLHARLPE